MKKTGAGLCSILFLLLVLPSSAQETANGQYSFVKERSINKSYPAKGYSLNIDNKFGTVKVIIWSKNEINVNAHIIASATDDDKAVAMFNAINVTEYVAGNSISFATVDGPVKGKECKECKSKWTIDYEIHLPAGTSLAIKNFFGAIDLPDYPGPLSLESAHGGITAGNLSNLKAISVSFGEAKISAIANSSAVFKWSSIEIGSLSGNNILVFDHCTPVTLMVGKHTGVLTLTETFSAINIKPDNKFSVLYSIESNRGTFKNTSNTDIARVDEVPKNDDDHIKKYSGKSGNGAAKISIKSSYGDVVVGDYPEGQKMKTLPFLLNYPGKKN